MRNAKQRHLIQLSPAWFQEEVDKRKAALVALQIDAISAIYSALGIEAVPVEGIPAVVATVSADDLAILGSLPQVGRVMYADGSATPNGAGDPLIYKGAVNGWTGYYGDGIWGQVPVCIMDSCGVHVDTELDVGEVAFPPGTPGACFTQHQTWMAELVRQVSAWPYGIAGNVVGQSSIGAKHYIANWDGGNWQFQLGGMAGMDEWCSDREVVVRNNAYTFIYAGYEDDIPSPADKFKDYTVVHPPYATQVMAAGKHLQYAGSKPDISWRTFNCIVVGASNDMSTADRAQHNMYYNSAWMNPDGGGVWEDFEVPHLVAPGYAVESANGPTGLSAMGTSPASAIATGIVAQLISRNITLKWWPEAIRAIMMAGATENIEGPVLDLGDEVDDKDGAGEVDAQRSINIADPAKFNSGGRPVPVGHYFDSVNFAQDFGRYYNVVWTTTAYYPYDYRLRVVLSWDASVECTNPADPESCGSQVLDCDLDLYVFEQGNTQPVAYSTSYDNSYEFIQFTPVPGRVYYIKVKKATSCPSTGTYMALAFSNGVYSDD